MSFFSVFPLENSLAKITILIFVLLLVRPVVIIIKPRNSSQTSYSMENKNCHSVAYKLTSGLTVGFSYNTLKHGGVQKTKLHRK